MLGVTSADAPALLGAQGFKVNLEHDWYRRALVLDHNTPVQDQIAFGAPRIERLAHFITQLNLWLPDGRRLLWIDHWENVYPNLAESMEILRTSVGVNGSVEEVPGLLFDHYPFDKEDFNEFSEGQQRATSIMVNWVTLMLLSRSEGWLIAEGAQDRVQFWEGNICFTSSRPESLAAADVLGTRYECPRDLL